MDVLEPNGKTESFSKERKDLKNQMDILELKNITPEIKAQ